MNSNATEAFVLLTLDNCALRDTAPTTHNGTLHLECVTIPSYQGDRDVYLVLRIGSFEGALDPTSVIDIEDDYSRGIRIYRFSQERFNEHAQGSIYPEVLSVRRPQGEKGRLGPHTGMQEDLETFESILAQYADVRRGGVSTPVTPVNEKSASNYPGTHLDPGAGGSSSASHNSLSDPSLRGHLVLVNQDNGELVGQVHDKRLNIQEDMLLRKPGHENDPVVIEVPDTYTPGKQDDVAMDVFVRTMTKEDEDFITKGATVVSHAISHTTTLLLTLVTAGANYYISKSQAHTPSQSRPPSPAPGTAAAARSAPGAPAQEQPSNVLAFLTSTKTRKNLSKVHALTGQAVHVSAKTVGMIDKMVKRTVDRNGNNTRPSAPSGSAKWNSPHSRLVHKASNRDEKGVVSSPLPRLQPGRSSPQPPSPVSYPTYNGSSSGAPPPSYSAATGSNPTAVSAPPRLPPRPLSRTAKVILSADLILSTLEENVKRLVVGGENTINNVVRHKYGEEAAESSSSMTGSAKNVVLVYIDMSGIGRRALLKKVGGEYVRARVMKNRREEMAQQQR